MSRPLGSKNKQQPVPWPMTLSTEERLEFLANTIIDAIIADQEAGGPLLKKIQAEQNSSVKSKLTT